MVKIKSNGEREFQSTEDQKLRAAKLRQLASKYDVREYMAELFLTEIRLSLPEENEKERETAKLLGLL